MMTAATTVAAAAAAAPAAPTTTRSASKPVAIAGGKQHRRTPSIDAAAAAAVGLAALAVSSTSASRESSSCNLRSHGQRCDDGGSLGISSNTGSNGINIVNHRNNNNSGNNNNKGSACLEALTEDNIDALDGAGDDKSSATQMSNSISSTFRGNASQFLQKYYSSKFDLPRELSESDLVDDYELGPVVGMGAFSIVRRAVNIHTGDKVAIKIISKADSENDVINMVANETAVWSTINHPNIIKLLRVIETRTDVCIISELAEGGSLLDYIVNAETGYLTEDEARPLFLQLFSVLAECHSRGVVHGDVKPDNILMTGDHKAIKLCDFGLSYIIDRTKSPLFDDSSSSSSSGEKEDYFSRSSFHGPSSASLSGTPLYLAPEVIKVSSEAGTKSDMWSAGVTLYAALTGRYPFDDDFTPRLQHKILNSDFELPDHLSADARDLISLLLNKNPLLRPTADDVLRHPWLRCAYTFASC